MFSEKELLSRINSANEKFVRGTISPDEPPMPVEETVEDEKIEGADQPVWLPIDIYQHKANKMAEMAKKRFPRGSSALVIATTKRIIDGEAPALALKKAKSRAEQDSKELIRRGERDRAMMVIRQYMEERFLPAIEVVVNYTSPDELLNCQEALDMLDSMAIGQGRMNGYTASYVRTAYKNVLGNQTGANDPTIVGAMRRIKQLVDSGEIRTAVGLAQKTKKMIDSGQHMASEDDYDLLGRIVAYAN